jgi:signal transduction histidine kinase/DNA-binding response OmpR family regulator
MNPSDKVNILLVDDRPENLLALEAILEPLQQNLIRANSGPEALKQVLAREFAVILLDVQMPGMNGFEAAQLIKARERSKHIPIIFLTAISKEEEYVFQGYTVGAVDYLAKPFNPDILRSKVGVFVDLYLKNQQIKRQEQMLRESERRELEFVHNARLHESELRLSEIVESALDAILMFDDSQRITLFNSAAERMFGTTRAEVLGKPVEQLLPQTADRSYVEGVCREHSTVSSVDGEAGGAAELPVPHVEAFFGRRGGPDGQEFPVEASISCLELRNHKVFTVIARDITERQKAEEALRTQAVSLANSAAELKALNQQLNQRQVELERAMSARSRFYASMSHELRTPINAILGYNTLMLENIYGPLNERQVHGLQRTQKAAKHLLELVNDVLDLSKIEAGKIEVQLQPVAFPALIEDLFITVRPMADERGSELSLDHQGDPITVITDPRRVRQILLNLLSNAIKFGRGNPIKVKSVEQEGGVSISVTDQGEGIAQEDLPRIFDEFVQLAHAHDHEGTGLGLPISKRLATLLNGSLDAVSKVNEGSTFTLVLPKTADASIRMATPGGPHPALAAQTKPAENGSNPGDGKPSDPANTPRQQPAAASGSAPRVTA